MKPALTACCAIKIKVASALRRKENHFDANRSLVEIAAKVCSEPSLTDAVVRAKGTLQYGPAFEG